MNILSIGNSFSNDAHRYLNRIAKSAGVELKTFNLFIGGCTLSTHYRNILSKKPEYTLVMNGESTGFKVSLDEALLNREWDIVTVQQASHESVDYEKYQPYLTELVNYIKKCAPKAKIALHETWAYEEGSERLTAKMGYKTQLEMYQDLEKAYKSAADDIKADFIIPSGELFQKLISAGIEKIHRDTFHASLGVGRYALGLLWYAVLCGKDVSDVSFSDFDEPVTDAEISIVKRCVSEIVNK